MRYYFEETIVKKAENYYKAFPGHVGLYAMVDESNYNQRAIRGCCNMIVSIWNEWRSDTRHYQPSNKKYDDYVKAVSGAEDRLDQGKPCYDLAVEVIRDTRKFLKMVVLYRVQQKHCRVM